MGKKTLIKPTKKALDRMLTISENYNTPEDHYDIVIQQDTLDADSVSYIINKAEEKNEYGRATRKLVSKKTREINVGITNDPANYEKYKKITFREANQADIDWHRAKFKSALLEKDYLTASLSYITLVNDHKDKEFIAECEKHKDGALKPLFDLISKFNGG